MAAVLLVVVVVAVRLSVEKGRIDFAVTAPTQSFDEPLRRIP